MFCAFGLSSVALAFRLRGAIPRRGVPRFILLLLALAGVGLIAAGVFEVGHSSASAAALAVMSPVRHHTRWTGLNQRLLWIVLITWLLRAAWEPVPQLDEKAA